MGVSVRSLSKSFGSGRVVEDLSFDVPDGRLLAVLGPSGSGKTTLLRCIAGIETPDAGTIKIGDTVVFDHEGRIDVPPEGRGVGMVFQSNALWPHMTVRKNVAYPLEVRGDTAIDEKVEDVLSVLKMERLAGRYPSEISGGEQQRVAIARAIVYRPSLVLLDEPFSSLDVLLRESLMDELKQLQRGLGICMVYVTHDRVEALSLGDELALMNSGRLAAYGNPEHLLRSPPDSYTAKFLGGMLVLDGEASPAPAGMVSVRTGRGTFEIPEAGVSGKVKFCIPPSACKITRQAKDPGIQGAVSGAVRLPSGYVGTRVSTDDGTVEVHSDDDGSFTPGESVRLALDLRKCFVLSS